MDTDELREKIGVQVEQDDNWTDEYVLRLEAECIRLQELVKNCSIPDVSNRRELLIDFSKRMFPKGDKKAQLLYIDQYLKGNL